MLSETNQELFNWQRFGAQHCRRKVTVGNLVMISGTSYRLCTDMRTTYLSVAILDFNLWPGLLVKECIFVSIIVLQQHYYNFAAFERK